MPFANEPTLSSFVPYVGAGMQPFQSDNTEEVRDRLQGHPLSAIDHGIALTNFCGAVKSNRELDMVLHNANQSKK